MRSGTAKLVVLGIAAVCTPAFAQDDGVIDLFDDQAKMSTSKIVVQGADGSAVGSGDGEDDYHGSLDGGFTLRFENNHGGILVPAKINGKKAYFIFDTGATITTLTTAFARSAGVSPPSGGPVLPAQTANGPMAMPLGVIDRLDLGGRPHGGVTYSVCDACPSGQYKGAQIVGLLGMNVIGRYRTSFDHGKGVIEMVPSSTYANRWTDIEPWVSLSVGEILPFGERKAWKLHGVIRNRAPRAIKRMTVKFSCDGSRGGKVDAKLRAGKTKKFQLIIEGGKCPSGFGGGVVGARW